MPARPSAENGWITREMALSFIAMATLPLWIGAVGLYQYLGIEIAIWMIYGLGFNLLLGYSGLPSFGHGAFFGIGAYAFGLFQAWAFESLLLGIVLATVAAFAAGAVVACFLSHRRGIYFALMTIAFGQVFWFVAIKWHTVTGGEDGLLNIPATRARVGRGVLAAGLQRRPLLLRAPGPRGRCRGAVAARPFAVRKGAAGGPAERGAGALRRLQRVALQVGGVLAVRGGGGAGRLALLHGAAERLPRCHEPARVGRDRHDDPDRRRVRQLLGTGRGRRGLLPGPGRPRRRHRDLAALVRAGVRGVGAVQARGDRGGLAGALRRPGSADVPRGRRRRASFHLPGGKRGPVRSARHTQTVRAPGGAGEHRPLVRGRPPERHHGTQRRRQDHLLQRAHRRVQARPGPGGLRRPGHHRTFARRHCA